jgi:ABC-type uncharacterized transport system permease subunit
MAITCYKSFIPCYLLDLKVWTCISCGSVATLVFTWLLVHICRRNKNKWLITNVIMLIFANIGTALIGISYYMRYITPVLQQSIRQRKTAVWLSAIGDGLNDGL